MLVTIEGKKGEEKLVTTSRRVAEDFERRHNDVVDSIKKILVTQNIVAKHFSEYEFEYRGQKFKGYLMDRDGFSLLVMGFTGEKALDWKISILMLSTKWKLILSEFLKSVSKGKLNALKELLFDIF